MMPRGINQSRTTEGARSSSLELRGYLRTVVSPNKSANEEQSIVAGTPYFVARAPQAALPNAIPPCRTKRYVESARARMNGGDMVCAATFRQARMAIHAAPLTNRTNNSHEKMCVLPAAKVLTAKTTTAAATTRSTEKYVRMRERTAAPASAPKPNEPSRSPYPVAACSLRRAMMGSSASRALAATLNAPVRISTQWTSG